MCKSLFSMAMLIAVFVFPKLSLAQVVPREVPVREVSVEEQKKSVVQTVAPFNPINFDGQNRQWTVSEWQRPGPIFIQPRVGGLANERKLSIGPLSLVSRLSARAPGQDVYYPTWERPQLTFWGISPMFSLRRDRYTKEYGFKIGIRKRF